MYANFICPTQQRPVYGANVELEPQVRVYQCAWCGQMHQLPKEVFVFFADFKSAIHQHA